MLEHPVPSGVHFELGLELFLRKVLDFAPIGNRAIDLLAHLTFQFNVVLCPFNLAVNAAFDGKEFAVLSVAIGDKEFANVGDHEDFLSWRNRVCLWVLPVPNTSFDTPKS